MVAVFAAPLGALTARLPRRPLLTTTLLAYAASSATMAIAGNYPVAFAARLLGGLTHGLFWAILGAYAARLVAPELLGRAMTLVSSGGALAVLIGIPAGTALGVGLGWRAAFAALTALTLLIAAFAAWVLRPVTGSGAPRRTPLREVLRLPGFATIVATTTATMLGAYALIIYTAPLLHHAGLPERLLAPVLVGSGLAGAATLPLAAWLIDRRLRTGVIAGILLITAAPLVYTLRPHSTGVAVTAMLMGGMAMGLLPSFLQTATLRTAPQHPEEASGINASAFNLGIAGGALVGSVAWDAWGVNAVPVAAAVLASAGLLIYLTAARRGRTAVTAHAAHHR
jgi:predicted MFS family arabinose efflux permease